ncbi:MAG: pilus assembly protein PilC, partial [Planctomycetaceae bacterium]|nr:pilus assembly protein PilC [Planctomycetaceae bacterium]
MPHYRYQTATATGEMTGGVITASSAVAATQQLRAQGIQPVNVTVVASVARSFLDRLRAMNHTSGPSTKDVHSFTTQLAVMIRAGVSIREALDGIADQATNPRFKALLVEIKQDVESGKSISDALARHPKQFNALYVNMVRASEMSGSFAQMLDRIAAYLQQQAETRSMVLGALIYPGVILTLAVGVTIFLLTWVLPKFTVVFVGKEEILPGPTVFLMALSAFMVAYWWAVLIGMVVGIGLFVTFIRTEVGRSWWDRAKLRIPLLSRMFRALYISRSLQTMGELVNAGVPMLDTLAITGDISGNQLYQRLWRGVHIAVKQGKKICQTLAHTALLPRSVVQMMSAGEESGKLGEVLDEISTYYARQLRETIKAVTSMIEPIS